MKIKYDPTEEQLKVIQTTDRTLLLSAAAGSGKTATLTNRLISMITRKDEPLDVTRMLVVTFTRAAAEDLRLQISAALAEAVAANPENTHLADQQLLLPSARIRTIDAFCNDLVKSHVDKLGISPFYRIADEAEIDLLSLSLLDDLIEEAYNGTFSPEGLDIVTIAELAESVKRGGSLAEQLYRLYKDNLHGAPKGVASLKSDAQTLLAEAEMPFFHTRFGKAIAKWYKEQAIYERDLLLAAKETLPGTAESDKEYFDKLKEKYFYLLDLYGEIEKACSGSFEKDLPADGSTEDGSLEKLKATLAAVSLPTPPSVSEQGTEEELFFKSLVKDGATKSTFATDPAAEHAGIYAHTVSWSAEELSYAFRRTAEITTSVYLLLSEFEARLFSEKKRRSIFDHGDITAFAYSLLCGDENEPTPLALELRASFDAVCIDEYQDVNEIQHRIFEVISNDHNRFMVGDIKQSIYAFRGGVPSIFKKLRDELPRAKDETGEPIGEVLYLTRNFRSEKPIIDFANHVFDFLFPIITKSINYDPDTDKLITKKVAGTSPLPTLHLFKANKETEYEQVAKKILSLLESGTLASGEPVRPSDIAVLAYKNDAELVETLRKHGIPVRTEDKTDFFSRKEILLALALLHAVSNPHRDIYLCGLLRSPLYGFTADELVLLRTRYKDGSLYESLCALQSTPPTAEDSASPTTAEALTLLRAKALRVWEDLARFRRMTENTPSHRLIRTLFKETGIYSVTDSAAHANLRTLYELARTFEANAFRGLYRFLDHIAEMRRLGRGLPKREVGEEEAVTVTTIHRSKGLEYPICILAQTAASLLHKRGDVPFSYTKEMGLLMPIPSRDGLSLMEPPFFLAEQYVRRKTEIEEAVRVLYVALTRPKEQLFISFATGAAKPETLRAKARTFLMLRSEAALHAHASYGLWILAALMNGGDKVCQVTEAPLSPDTVEKESPDLPKAPEGSDDTAEALLDVYRERFSFRYPHEVQTRLPAKLSVSKLRPDLLDGVLESPSSALLDTEEDADATADGEFRPTAPAFIAGKGRGEEAARAGTATHVFLQFCDFDRILSLPPSLDVIKEELARLTALRFLPEKEAACVRVNELTAFLTSPLADVLRSAKSVLREFRFHALLPAENFAVQSKRELAGSTVFVQGVTDLLVERGDESLLLIDYKTDRVWEKSKTAAAKRLFARHGTQLSVYALAIERMLGKRPDVAIYSLPMGTLLTPSDAEETI